MKKLILLLILSLSTCLIATEKQLLENANWGTPWEFTTQYLSNPLVW